jgi:hypothetical protein
MALDQQTSKESQEQSVGSDSSKNEFYDWWFTKVWLVEPFKWR